MFGVDTSELIIVALAALIFIGPKELPGAMRTLGRWIGKARGHARHFTSGIENMMREAELEEMEKRWRDENDRIMREHPMSAVPYAGASVEGPTTASPGSELAFGTSEKADDPPNALVTNGSSSDPHVSQMLAPSDIPAHQPPATTLPDEPGLPLPEPDHQRRELP